jgi:integrase
MKLTQAKVRALKLKAGQTEAFHFDDDIPGFGVRLRDGGSATWIFQYRLPGLQRRMTLGNVSAVPAGEARKIASQHYGRVLQGQDLAAEKARARDEAASTFGSLMRRFLERQRSRLRPRSYEETERYLLKHCAAFHKLPLVRIDRRMVSERLKGIADESGPVAADRARAALSAFFAWTIREGEPVENPTIGTNTQSTAKPRDRVLTDAELRSVWRALPDSDFGAIVKLLILTGQRRDEIADLCWSEIDMERGVISLPSDRTKNKLPHDVPMSGAVLAILGAIPQREGRDLVFGQGQGGFSGWSNSKEWLDEAAPLAHWTLHDLRRTVATGMGELGVQPHIIEACLNHISGHRRGVAGVYNRAVYATEKTRALALWAEHVAAVVEDRKARVVPLKTA